MQFFQKIFIFRTFKKKKSKKGWTNSQNYKFFLYSAKYLNSKKSRKFFIESDFWEIRRWIFRKISKNFIT